MTKKAIAPHLKKVLQDYLNSVKNAKKSDLEKPYIPDDDIDLIHSVEQCLISSYLLGMIHAEEERPERKINAGDVEIPPVKFEEAVEFLKRKVSLSKENYYSLENKLRFRAFTISKLGSVKALEYVKNILIDSLKDGTSYSETWEQLKNTVDTTNLTPGYWENIFRTNTQSAYMAGKLEQYAQFGDSVQAYQLLIIEDSRTSRFCRKLLTASNRGFVIAKNNPFWQKYGFPPYHFQCRSSVRAILKNQIAKNGIIVENPTKRQLQGFKPMEGFGGNPLDSGNWWKLTSSQLEQAIKYGILRILNREDNIFADYDSLWKGYKRKIYKSGGWYDLTEVPPNDWEGTDFPNKPIVEFLAEHGYRIKVIPGVEQVKNKYGVKWTNPDILLNEKLTDIKTVDTSIKSRLKAAKDQKVKNVVLFIPEKFSEKDIEEAFNDWSHGTLNIIYIYKGEIKTRNLK